MSHVDASALSQYNSLMDPHLSGYFNNSRMRRHLKKSGMIDRRGEIVSENTYRLNMARKEHKKHVRELLAQAIVHKTLDMERNRQVEIRKKLEEIAKIELVRRVRMERGRKGDEEVLPYLTPRRGRPTSAYTPANGAPATVHLRPKSAPSSRVRNRQRRSRSPGSDRLIAVDENGMPLTPRERSGSLSSNSTVQGRQKKPGKKSKYPKGELDDRHLYALDQHTLREYKMAQYEIRNGRGPSPFLSPQPGLPSPPKSGSPRTAQLRGRRRIVATNAQGRPVKGRKGKSPTLHRREPAMQHSVPPHTRCAVTIHYFGSNLRLDYEKFDPRDQITVEQQHCGGNTLYVFREKILPGTDFTFESRRHFGYPFGLTFYINGLEDCRLSTCCEYRHSQGAKLGGKLGHFGIVSVEGSTPCYKCQVSDELRKSHEKPVTDRSNTKRTITRTHRDDSPTSHTVDVSDRRPNSDRRDAADTNRSVPNTVLGLSDNEEETDRRGNDTSVTVPVTDEDADRNGNDDTARYESDFEPDDGDVSDGDVSDGDVSDGDVSDGDVNDGDVSDRNVSDRDVSDHDEAIPDKDESSSYESDFKRNDGDADKATPGKEKSYDDDFETTATDIKTTTSRSQTSRSSRSRSRSTSSRSSSRSRSVTPTHSRASSSGSARSYTDDADERAIAQ